MTTPFRTPFSEDIARNKYLHPGCDTWDKLSHVLGHEVMGGLDDDAAIETFVELHSAMKVMAGGRYLYYAGRDRKFYSNCYILKSEEDTREDWADTSWKAESCLMTGGGIGNDYSVYRPKGTLLKSTGGAASGAVSKMRMINEIGREVMQGAGRRSAVFASLNWRHGDVGELLHAKDWFAMKIGDTTLGDLKALDPNFPCPLDMTNISLNYDNAFLDTVSPGATARGRADGLPQCLDVSGELPPVFVKNVEQALRTGEPGMCFNMFDKEVETGRNACGEVVSADDSDVCIAKGQRVLTSEGYKPIERVTSDDRVGSLIDGKVVFRKPLDVWSNGVRETIAVVLKDGRELTCTEDHRVLTSDGYVKARDLSGRKVVTRPWDYEEHEDTPLDREYFALGWQTGDGWLTPRSKGWGYVFGSEEDIECREVVMSWVNERYGGGRSQTQANGVECLSIGSSRKKIEYENEYGITIAKSPCKRVPTAVFTANLSQKRSFLAGLFATDGTAKTNRRKLSLSSSSKRLLQDVQLLLSELGIYSWIGFYKVPGRNDQGRLDINGKSAIRFMREIGFGPHAAKTECGRRRILERPKKDSLGRRITPYRNPEAIAVSEIVAKGRCEVFDMSFDENHNFIVEGVVVHNCNLASVNMSRIETIEEFATAVEMVCRFLVCGGIRGELPYDKVRNVRGRNRRIGCGLMGMHEWLLMRGYRYECVPELKEWLEVWRDVSERSANAISDRLGVNRPLGYRAIAPTGTIGLVAGTTTGIEPLFAVAYERRYIRNGTDWERQYVVDGTARALIDKYDLDPDGVECAIDLAKEPRRRIQFQADVNDYCDMGISSTINLPRWGSKYNNETTVMQFAGTLAGYAHRLRGFTCYPDGARGNQPLTTVDFATASAREGAVFKEKHHDICELSGKGGTCGA